MAADILGIAIFLHISTLRAPLESHIPLGGLDMGLRVSSHSVSIERDLRIQTVGMPSSITSITKHEGVLILASVLVDFSVEDTHLSSFDFAYLAHLTLHTIPIVRKDGLPDLWRRHPHTAQVRAPFTSMTRNESFGYVLPIPFRCAETE